MSAELANRDRTARLSIVFGTGAFGDEVTACLERHSSALPEPLQLATEIVASRSRNGAPVERLRSARNRLTRIEHIAGIEESGWELESQLRRRLRYYLIGECSEAESLLNLVKELQEDHPGDSFYLLLFSPGGRAPSRMSSISDVSDGLFLVSDQNASGESVSRAFAVSSVAGTLMLCMRTPLLERTASRSSVAAFGFAGYYGLTGPALLYLAQVFGLRLLTAHLNQDADLEGTSNLVDSILDEFDPRRLIERLFERKLQNAGTSTPGILGDDDIPAVPHWDGDMFSVESSRGSLALELTRAGREEEWARKIRRYVRTTDMTSGYQWKARLDGAARELAARCRNQLDGAFERVLTEEARAPHVAERVTDRLVERLSGDLDTQADPSRDLEAELDELDERVHDRSDRLALAARLALWVFPAVVVGIPVVRELYMGLRGTVFPVLFGSLGTAAALGWYLWRLDRENSAIRTVRNRALEIVTRRKEAILAENALSAFREFVEPALRAFLTDEVRPVIESYREKLSNVERDFERPTRESLDEPPAFAPVLSWPAEFRRLADRLELFGDAFLDKAIEQQVLLHVLAEQKLEERLSGWCERASLEAASDHGIGFSDLWEIRRGTRDNEEELQSAIARLWRFAVPLWPGAELQREWTVEVAILPTSLSSRIVASGSELPFPEDCVQEVSDFDLAGCFRVAPLDPKMLETR